MNVLDNIPLATIKSLVFDVLVVIAYLDNKITFDQAAIAFGIGNAGVGVLGYARATSGKGVK